MEETDFVYRKQNDKKKLGSIAWKYCLCKFSKLQYFGQILLSKLQVLIILHWNWCNSPIYYDFFLYQEYSI